MSKISFNKSNTSKCTGIQTGTISEAVEPGLQQYKDDEPKEKFVIVINIEGTNQEICQSINVDTNSPNSNKVKLLNAINGNVEAVPDMLGKQLKLNVGLDSKGQLKINDFIEADGTLSEVNIARPIYFSVYDDDVKNLSEHEIEVHPTFKKLHPLIKYMIRNRVIKKTEDELVDLPI